MNQNELKELIVEIQQFLNDYENSTELFEYEDYINYLSDSVLLLERAQKNLIIQLVNIGLNTGCKVHCNPVVTDQPDKLIT